MRLLLVLSLSVLPLLAVDDCQQKLATCAKTNNCLAKPDTTACKACKAAYDSCVAAQPTLRGKFQKTTGKK